MFIAHEAPVPNIALVRELTDLDFVIAHFVHEEPGYAEACRERPKGRYLILDNGFFELRQTFSPKDLLETAKMVEADCVIAPDIVNDFPSTKEMVKEFLFLAKDTQFAVGAVIVGKDPEEMVKCFKWYTSLFSIQMMCWSFLGPRAEALSLIKRVPLDRAHHLLGFSTLDELAQVLPYFPGGCSIDTMKPVSAAYNKKEWQDTGRGGYKRPGMQEKVPSILLAENILEFRRRVRRVEPE